MNKSASASSHGPWSRYDEEDEGKSSYIGDDRHLAIWSCIRNGCRESREHVYDGVNNIYIMGDVHPKVTKTQPRDSEEKW